MEDICRRPVNFDLEEAGSNMISMLGTSVFFKMVVQLLTYKPQLEALVRALLNAVGGAQSAVVHLRQRDCENLVAEDSFQSVSSCINRLHQLLRFLGTILNLDMANSNDSKMGSKHEPFGSQDVVWLVGYRGHSPANI